MYREAAREARDEAVSGDVLVRLDASGAAGAAGRDGLAGADGAGCGADGRAGGHAGAAEPGGDAGRLAILLADERGTVSITGERTMRGRASEAIRERRAIGERGFVDLVARGGAGGRGGRGGKGGDGATGRRGDDATRYSNGTDGGPGGDGGRGGRGSSGATGGRGGTITVTVRDEDTHLLMLVRHGVEGGAGGRRGEHGRGGNAGSGGEGGSSYSWTTTESYTDSQGHSQTRTQHHRNSGGWTGPSGSAGQPGSGPLTDGAAGARGAFTYEVLLPTGEAELYEARYQLALSGLEIHTPDADGITEPGETVELRRVRVTNVGGMPLPRHRETRLEVATSNWARPIDGAALVVPRGLPAGATVELEGVLPFALREYASTAESDPLSDPERIVIDARVPDVARSFDGFLAPAMDAARTLVVRFPVALSVLEGLGSLAPGEVTRVRFAVRNQSRQPLGASSASGRRLRVSLRLFESELDDRHVVLFDEAGAPCVLGGDGLVREIERLEPGADVTFELALGVQRDAPSYRVLRVRLTLEIGRLEAPEVLRVVQHRALEVRVAERVGAQPFDWLLVTNQSSTREEVEAWRTLAERQGVALALYDLSLHGDLGLERPFEGGPSLVSRARGGLVILLGYAMPTPGGPRRATSFLTPELVREMAVARADLLVIGAEGTLREWTRAELGHDVDSMRVYESPRAWLAALERARHEVTDAERGLATAARVPIYEIAFGLEDPSEPRLAARALALAETLARRFPEREHEVAYEFDPDLAPSWAPIRRRRLGFLHVVSRAAGRSGLAQLTLTDEEAHDPRRVASEEMARATLLARGIDDRVRALAECLAVSRPDLALAGALADAVLVTIACEQLAVVRRTRARAGLDRAALVRALEALERLATTRLLGPHGASSEVGALIARIAARARFFARAQAALWERIPGLSWLRRSAAMIEATDDAIERFLACQSGDPDVARVLGDRLRVELELLEGDWRAARARGEVDRAAFAREQILRTTWDERFTIDEELRLEHVPSASTKESWDAARTAARAARGARAEEEGALDTHRARLLVPGTTDEWLARAAEEERAQLHARVGQVRAATV